MLVESLSEVVAVAGLWLKLGAGVAGVVGSSAPAVDLVP